ncbi:hypothetical protein ACFE04_025921 [Oxalis oulophora]
MEQLVGFRFRPTEQQLLGDYLCKKITNNIDPELDLPTIDFYGESLEISEIWDMLGGPAQEEECTGDADVYVYTHLKKKSSTRNNGGKNYIRSVGTSSWQAETSNTPILDVDDDYLLPILGSKRRFKYVNKKKPESEGLWNLMEYSMEGSSLLELNPNLPRDVVLCRIRKNKKQLAKKRKLENDQYFEEAFMDE